jgi:hypothetical protein
LDVVAQAHSSSCLPFCILIMQQSYKLAITSLVLIHFSVSFFKQIERFLFFGEKKLENHFQLEVDRKIVSLFDLTSLNKIGGFLSLCPSITST